MKIRKRMLMSLMIVIVAVSMLFLLQQGRASFKSVNVIFIVVDSLRPDHLGSYGYKRNTSPHIDNWSREGIRFTQAIAAGGRSIESVPSLLTGASPLTHQIRDWIDLREPSVKTLAWELTRRGYQCALWSNHAPIEDLDIRLGFHEIHIISSDKSDQPLINDSQFTSEVIDWLESSRDRLFFLYIHYSGLHVPYRPPEPYKSMFANDKLREKGESAPLSSFESEIYDGRGVIPYAVAENNITDPNYYISQYDGTISYVDTQIGRLVDSIKELHLDKNTLIVLTADHAEMLGEHNIYFNHYGIYEENIRVPLIISFPEMLPKAEVISRQVSLLDIAPTVLEIAGLHQPHYMQGESLLSFLRPFRIYRKNYVFSCSSGTVALRTEKWKLIDNGDYYELYHLGTDPQEQYNVVGEKLREFKHLRHVLEDWKKKTNASLRAKKGPPLTIEKKKRLRSLGYVQ